MQKSCGKFTDYDSDVYISFVLICTLSESNEKSSKYFTPFFKFLLGDWGWLEFPIRLRGKDIYGFEIHGNKSVLNSFLRVTPGKESLLLK